MNLSALFVIAAAVAAGLSLGFCGLGIWLGPRVGFVDRPDAELKPHGRPVPPLGGIGVYVALLGGMAVAGAFDWGFVAAATVVLLVGLVDDRRGLAPPVRLLLEVVAAVMLLLLSTAVPALNALTAAIALVVILVSVNAVNLFDGLDGLVGSVGIVTAIGIWLLGQGQDAGVAVGLVLAGALAGFLLLNWRPARIFLGDNGAYLVGLTIAYGLIVASPRGRASDLVIASGLLGVFALDLVITILRRARNRRPLFAGDRSHVYDQLVDRGWSVPKVAIAAAAGQVVVDAVVIFVGRSVSSPEAPALLGLAALGVIAVAWKLGFLDADTSSATR